MAFSPWISTFTLLRLCSYFCQAILFSPEWLAHELLINSSVSISFLFTWVLGIKPGSIKIVHQVPLPLRNLSCTHLYFYQCQFISYLNSSVKRREELRRKNIDYGQARINKWESKLAHSINSGQSLVNCASRDFDKRLDLLKSGSTKNGSVWMWSAVAYSAICVYSMWSCVIE